MTNTQKTTVGAVALATFIGGSILMLNIGGLTEPVLQVWKTNFNGDIHINWGWEPKDPTNHYYLYKYRIVNTNENPVQMPDVYVFCSNAVVLEWYGIEQHCYQIQWSSNMVDWISNRVWRVGEGTNIFYYAPIELSQGVFKLMVEWCPTNLNNIITPSPPLPPPPPPPNNRIFAIQTPN